MCLCLYLCLPYPRPSPSLSNPSCQAQLKNAILYDWDAVQGATAELQAAFPPHACHCFAAKAAPLPYLLHHFVQVCVVVCVVRCGVI